MLLQKVMRTSRWRGCQGSNVEAVGRGALAVNASLCYISLTQPHYAECSRGPAPRERVAFYTEYERDEHEISGLPQAAAGSVLPSGSFPRGRRSTFTNVVS